MKFMPCSAPTAIIRSAPAWSVSLPKIIVPRHTGETFRPVRPNLRYCMHVPPACPSNRSRVDKGTGKRRTGPPSGHRSERSVARLGPGEYGEHALGEPPAILEPIAVLIFADDFAALGPGPARHQARRGRGIAIDLNHQVADHRDHLERRAARRAHVRDDRR